MPLRLPKDLINKELLLQEKIFVIEKDRADNQDIRPIRVAIVNLMPNKEETEIQLLRFLSNQALQVDIDLIRTASYEPKHTDMVRLNQFYKTYEQIKENKYDAMIVTGAPLERKKYESIQYWKELQQIFDFAKKNVFSTLFICWAAQAAMHYYYQIESELAQDKIFGVYPFQKQTESDLLKGFDDYFYIPQSRYSFIRESSLTKVDDLVLLASSKETGIALACSKDKRFVFSFGHWEYDKLTLHQEYQRDLERGISIQQPCYYYSEQQDPNSIMVNWKAAGSMFFTNWINHAVYQRTPYDTEQIKTKSVSKFGGSSLSDSLQFRKVKNIIQKDDDRQVVVVSAPGKRHPLDQKVTDMLIDIAQIKSQIKEMELIIRNLKEKINDITDKNQDQIQAIKERFYEIAEDLGLNEKIKQTIDNCISEIQQAQSKDFIISRGEYLNAILMASYLKYEFVDAKELIYFSENGLDLEKSYRIIQQRIKPGRKVVIPGFYGNKDGEIKVFGRGGSDYTGSILASALNTNVYENWTDVDGIMTADPNKDPSARKITRLKYQELQDVIQAGAEVYQQEAIQPVREKNITVRILNTNNPHEEGTWIQD